MLHVTQVWRLYHSQNLPMFREMCVMLKGKLEEYFGTLKAWALLWPELFRLLLLLSPFFLLLRLYEYVTSVL